MGAQNSTALDSSDAAADLLTTVLRHAMWKERAAALAVCRAWRNRLLQDDFYYKWLCERLHAEHLQVNVPLALEPVAARKPLRSVHAACLALRGGEGETDNANAFD